MSTRLNIVIPEELKYRLEAQAQIERTTVSYIVRESVGRYLKAALEDDGGEVADISDLFPFYSGGPDDSMTVDEAVYGIGKPR